MGLVERIPSLPEAVRTIERQTGRRQTRRGASPGALALENGTQPAPGSPTPVALRAARMVAFEGGLANPSVQAPRSGTTTLTLFTLEPRHRPASLRDFRRPAQVTTQYDDPLTGSNSATFTAPDMLLRFLSDGRAQAFVFSAPVIFTGDQTLRNTSLDWIYLDDEVAYRAVPLT